MLLISPLLLHISPTTNIIITMSNTFFLLSLLIVPVASFLSTVNTIQSRPLPTQPSTSALFSAMERLHDKSTNAFGRIEHVYSLNDIDNITRKIAEDEWMAGLGTAIAEAMYEMILDVSNEAMHEMGFVERMSVTNKIADDVTSAVEVSSQYNVIICYSFWQCSFTNNILSMQKALNKIRAQPVPRSPYPLPEELLTSLHSLLRHELATITGMATFDYNGHDLSLLVLSSVTDAIESYCGITNINAPFFGLGQEMDHRIRDRRRDLLLKHAKGYESVKDINQDIEASRKEWLREVLGYKAAKNFHFGEVTTKNGNVHIHQEEKQKKEKRAKLLSNLLSIHV